MELYIIMACHNRRASTLRCIESAHDSARAAQLEIHITLYDDGSSDGTAETIMAEFPDTRILSGSGSDYWAKSMAFAETDAIQRIRLGNKPNPYIVWLNDDVILDRDSFQRMSLITDANSDDIVIGSMRDPESGAVTYSGLRKHGLHPLSFQRVPASSTSQAVEVFNGNLVFVPWSVAVSLGGIDGDYSHALADIDYGLRAKAKGVGVQLAPGTFGTCARNAIPRRRAIAVEWRQFVGPKGPGNPKSMRKILKLTSPKSWPFYFFASYGLWWSRRLLSGVKTSLRTQATNGR